MIQLSRPPTPEFLAGNEDKWGDEFAAKRAENAGYRFQWKSVGGVPVNVLLLPFLRQMTARHCAYCDGFPLGPFARETIDHFRPKSKFESDVYRWSNLFLACDVCQKSKGEEYSETALRPDAEAYSFDKYFLFNIRTGDIEPNPIGTTAEEQHAARETIAWFGLNDHERSEYRRTVFQERFLSPLPAAVEHQPYRFLISLVPPSMRATPEAQ